MTELPPLTRKCWDFLFFFSRFFVFDRPRPWNCLFTGLHFSFFSKLVFRVGNRAPHHVKSLENKHWCAPLHSDFCLLFPPLCKVIGLSSSIYTPPRKTNDLDRNPKAKESTDQKQTQKISWRRYTKQKKCIIYIILQNK